MPSTLTGLLLFVALLAPGIIYSAERGRRFPQRDRTTLSETGSTVLVSVGCFLAALLILMVLRLLVADITPDVGAIARRPSAYWHHHYQVMLAWGGLLLLGSCGLAYSLAHWLKEPKLPVHRESGWYLALETMREEKETEVGIEQLSVHAGVVLIDGSYLSGYVASFGLDSEDSPDRDLVLSAPITYRENPSAAERPRDGVHVATVSARQIKAVFFTYRNPANL